MKKSNLHSRRIAVILAILSVSCTGISMAQGSRDLAALGNWMAHYYEHPQPDALPAWIAEVAGQGGLDKPSVRFPTMVFVSEVARRHPGKIATWCDALGGLSSPHRASMAWSFRHASAVLPESCTRGLDAVNLERLQASANYSALTREPGRPGDLDLLWATFMASGEASAVMPIIDVLSRPLPEKGSPGSVEALLLHGSAKWSLTSNVAQHERVRAIVEQRRLQATGPLRQELDDILGQRR